MFCHARAIPFEHHQVGQSQHYYWARLSDVLSSIPFIQSFTVTFDVVRVSARLLEAQKEFSEKLFRIRVITNKGHTMTPLVS